MSEPGPQGEAGGEGKGRRKAVPMVRLPTLPGAEWIARATRVAVACSVMVASAVVLLKTAPADWSSRQLRDAADGLRGVLRAFRLIKRGAKKKSGNGSGT